MLDLKPQGMFLMEEWFYTIQTSLERTLTHTCDMHAHTVNTHA